MIWSAFEGDAGYRISPEYIARWCGADEGLTPKEIDEGAPGWLIFRDGCPGGESPEQIGARVDRVIARSRKLEGDVALFAHEHVLRVLVRRWIVRPAGAGQSLLRFCVTLWGVRE